LQICDVLHSVAQASEKKANSESGAEGLSRFNSLEDEEASAFQKKHQAEIFRAEQARQDASFLNFGMSPAGSRL
jgi:hypothetical protein